MWHSRPRLCGILQNQPYLCQNWLCLLFLLRACSLRLGAASVPLDLYQSGSLAFQAAQVIQLGAADARGTQDFNLVNHLGVGGKNTLHSLAEADLAHSKAGLRSGALGNHSAFESLQSLLITFLDPYVHTDGVARGELGNVAALQLGIQFIQ